MSTEGTVFPDAQPPGHYKVGYIPKAQKEGQKLLNEVQYAYAVRQAQRLRFWDDSEEMGLLRIEAVDEFHELKMKGNVLGKTNLRVFFAVFDDEKLVVVLGVYKKEEEDELPRHVIIGMRNRRRVVMAELRKPVKKG